MQPQLNEPLTNGNISVGLPIVVQAYTVNENNQIKRDWPLDICDCFNYIDPVTKDCVWFPNFFPMSLVSPCIIAGKIQTLLVSEREVCCEMGEKGLTCCCLSAIPACFSPFGGACYFSLLALAWRAELTARFNMNELPQTCTCFGPTINPLCEVAHLAMLYPCSFFQIYVTLKEIHREDNLLSRAYLPS